MSLEHARAVADAVLYEGYLLYPYRATSSKNQSRWQWGVLGPPGAAAAGLGEDSTMSTQCLVRGPTAAVDLRLRFLQLQTRGVERADPRGASRFEPVAELRSGDRTWLSWDEAVAHEVELGPYPLAGPTDGRSFPVSVPGGTDIEPLTDQEDRGLGRIVRRRWPLAAEVRVAMTPVGTGADGLVRLTVTVDNIGSPASDKPEAIRGSFIGTHLILAVTRGEFVSLLEPPDDARAAAQACEQRRCWPVLAGAPGRTDIILVSPIILYDYPEVAEQSAGALFDSTEIDEILTLRVMTLTDEEKAAARATDPRAAEIIDRCDQMSPESLQALHGILRDPHAGVDATSFRHPGSLREPPDLRDVPTFGEPASHPTDIRNAEPPTFDTGGAPWWDPAADASVQPEADSVMISGVPVAKDSLVRLHPSRRADAQDLFFADQTARVTAVLSDVDGQIHVAVVLTDDPAAEMHEWYGRYMYFAPEELEPLGRRSTETTSDHREESRS